MQIQIPLDFRQAINKRMILKPFLFLSHHEESTIGANMPSFIVIYKR